MLVNYLAVLLAALVAMVVGSFWYSPLVFGRQWMRLRGVDPRSQAGAGFPAQEALLEFVCALVTAYALSIFAILFGAHTAYAAAVLAFIVWIGFYVTQLLGEVLWEKKPFGLFLITGSLRLITLVFMTLIVGLWQ